MDNKQKITFWQIEWNQTNESSQREQGALLGKAPRKFFIRLGSNPSNFSTETCLKQVKTFMLMAKSPCLYSFWFGDKFLRSKNKIATIVIFDFRSMCEQHKMRMHTNRSVFKTFKNRQLRHHDGHLGFVFENESNITLLRTSIFNLYICLYMFRQDSTIFYKVRILAGNAFYVWRHNRHFENRSTPNLKREAFQPKLHLVVLEE